ncbi:MAG: hypothetical protein KDA63_05215 [Planctomycetales bacterium]|nr:hypothetical protein [Planctomycetales bacterium]
MSYLATIGASRAGAVVPVSPRLPYVIVCAKPNVTTAGGDNTGSRVVDPTAAGFADRWCHTDVGTTLVLRLFHDDDGSAAGLVLNVFTRMENYLLAMADANGDYSIALTASDANDSAQTGGGKISEATAKIDLEGNADFLIAVETPLAGGTIDDAYVLGTII